MKTQREWKFHFPSTHVGTHSTKEIVYNGGTIRSINKIDWILSIPFKITRPIDDITINRFY